MDLGAGLLHWLGHQLTTTLGGPPVDLELSDLQKPPIGQSSDTYLFTASWIHEGVKTSGDYVLRLQATARQLFHKPDVIRECQVLDGLQQVVDVPVPRTLWREPDASILGAPFFVMEQVRGRVPSGRPSIHAVGWLTELTSEQLAGLWESAFSVMVAVHNVDWQKSHGFLLDGDPKAATVTAHLDRLVRWYRWSTQDRPFEITDAAVAWLLERVDSLRVDEPVLVWGDSRVGNMIFGDDLTVAAAIDWEVASIGAGEIDLAHWLFFDEFTTAAAGVERLPGWPNRDATVERYRQLSGSAVQDLEFFEIMDHVFMATTLIRQADIRVEQGVTAPGTRMGNDNIVTQMLARRLDLPVPDLSPDYLAHRTGTPPAAART
ncbi:MAG: phosphotransferase [Acidimicrobiia bacterium]|nr:phosphotransferase [Acidimicrobiia bacterium]